MYRQLPRDSLGFCQRVLVLSTSAQRTQWNETPGELPGQRLPEGNGPTLIRATFASLHALFDTSATDGPTNLKSLAFLTTLTHHALANLSSPLIAYTLG